MVRVRDPRPCAAHPGNKETTSYSSFAASFVLILSSLVVTGCPQSSSEFGHFDGKLQLEHVSGQVKKTVSDFAYVDSAKKRWDVPLNYETNGASIPRALWSIVGGPFSDDYVLAAAVHDVYCDEKYRADVTPVQVHRMFYEACRCAGVEASKAMLMYVAVYRFGPWWGDTPRPLFPHAPSATPQFETEAFPPADSVDANEQARLEAQRVFLRKCQVWIEANDPTLEDAESWTPSEQDH